MRRRPSTRPHPAALGSGDFVASTPRKRLLLLGALALALVFGFARPGDAQEADPGASTTALPSAVLPVDPAVPVEPAAPVGPAAAVDPGAPVDPAAPADPAAEVTPVAPAAPLEPAVPVEPAAVSQEEPAEGDIEHEAEVIAEENGADESDVECVPILMGGGSVDDCQEAPNPLLPEINEIIWGALAFAVVFFFLAKFGLPQIRKGMDARTERIRNDLQSAETQRSDAEGLLAEYRAQLNDARSEAGRIIEASRQAADDIKRDQEARLQTELAELRERAVADIETAKVQAMADLRGEVAQLAIGAAEAVVQRSLDAKTQTRLVEQYIDSVGTRSS